MIGSTLSHYRITAQLGRGGMGVVYEAEDLELERRVAIKLLPRETAATHEILQRFRREAEIIAALSHPNVVSLHSIEEADGHHFLTMELVEGESLDRVLRQGPLPLTRALRIGEAIAAALAAAHELGVVHRDVKPANVMLTPDDHVKVLDFGIGKLTAKLGAGDDPTPAPLTRVGAVLGTINYMSPEQARGEVVDHRSDIFSLGSLLYEAVAGELPFRGKSSVDDVLRLFKEDPPPMGESAPGTPPEFERIVIKALAKAPANRYQTARELQLDLRNLRRDLDLPGALPGLPPPATGAVKPPPSRARAAVLILCALIAIAAALVFWWPLGCSDREPAQGGQSLQPHSREAPQRIELIPPRRVQLS